MSKKVEIKRAAIRLFATKGFRGTSAADLAAAIHSAEGTIFYHFKTKEDILLAILLDLKEELLSEFERPLSSKDATGLERLQDIIGRFFELVAAHPDAFQLLHNRFPYELAAQNAACREHLEAIYSAFIGAIETAIRAGQADGSMREVNPARSAMVVMAMLDGLVRFHTLALYDVSTIFDEVMTSCRRMLCSTP